jgi:O-antigen/teichoic acid export membrane protein
MNNRNLAKGITAVAIITAIILIGLALYMIYADLSVAVWIALLGAFCSLLSVYSLFTSKAKSTGDDE